MIKSLTQVQRERATRRDIEALCGEYRELYWFINELQLCGESAWTSPEYKTAVKRSDVIVKALGFTPEA